MRCQSVPSAEIDVCDACDGLWVDWFDGEIHTVAAEVAARRELGARTHRSSRAPIGTCPRCRQALRAELHRFPDAREGELVDGVELYRCPECAGSFVPRGSAHLLLDRALEPPAVTLWEAFVAVLKRLVGASER
jgi:Zn-finger nucleic acid-binding protein